MTSLAWGLSPRCGHVTPWEEEVHRGEGDVPRERGDCRVLSERPLAVARQSVQFAVPPIHSPSADLGPWLDSSGAQGVTTRSTYDNGTTTDFR